MSWGWIESAADLTGVNIRSRAFSLATFKRLPILDDIAGKTGSGKPDHGYAPRARGIELDPVRELPYGPAACDGRTRGRTHVSTRPRSVLFQRFFLRQRGRPHMSMRMIALTHLKCSCPAQSEDKQNHMAQAEMGGEPASASRRQKARLTLKSNGLNTTRQQ